MADGEEMEQEDANLPNNVQLEKFTVKGISNTKKSEDIFSVLDKLESQHFSKQDPQNELNKSGEHYFKVNDEIVDDGLNPYSPYECESVSSHFKSDSLNAFKKPICPVKSSRKRKPDFLIHPGNWTQYDLSCVTESEMTDSCNTSAALNFLSDLAASKKKIVISENSTVAENSEQTDELHPKYSCKNLFKKNSVSVENFTAQTIIKIEHLNEAEDEKGIDCSTMASSKETIGSDKKLIDSDTLTSDAKNESSHNEIIHKVKKRQRNIRTRPQDE